MLFNLSSNIHIIIKPHILKHHIPELPISYTQYAKCCRQRTTNDEYISTDVNNLQGHNNNQRIHFNRCVSTIHLRDVAYTVDAAASSGRGKTHVTISTICMS